MDIVFGNIGAGLQLRPDGLDQTVTLQAGQWVEVAGHRFTSDGEDKATVAPAAPASTSKTAQIAPADGSVPYASTELWAFNLAKGIVTPHAPQTDASTQGSPYSGEVSPQPGDVTPMGYPDRSQSALLVHCTQAGMYSFGPFTIPAASASHNAGHVSVASPDDHGVAGELVVATSPGTVSGGAVLPDAWVSGTYPAMLMVVGRPAGPGEGASLPVDVPLYVNFHVSIPGNFILKVDAPNRY